MRNTRFGTALTALLFIVPASVSIAQQLRPALEGAPQPHMRPLPTIMPLVTPSPRAPMVQLRRNLPIPGQSVPLAALPPLPPKTTLNTASFDASGGRRIMAANGAYIQYSADTTGNSACSGASGTIIPLGCDVLWQSRGLPPGQTWQDYFINYNSSSATAVGTNYGGGGGVQNKTANLPTSGIYVLATLDVATNSWEAVTYVTVGSSTYFGSYADSAAKIPQQQFTAASGTNVYLNATGLTQGQQYVVYAEWTSGGLVSGNLSCVYIAPPGTATPNPTGFCDPTTSPGITALVGAQSSASITATWPLSASTPAGTYAVVLYDLTTNTRIAMRQVSIVKSGTTGSIPLVPISGNPNLPAGWPTPVPAPYSATTTFAYDNPTEQSDKGWTMNATGLPINTNYTVTVSDPTGRVVASNPQGTGAAGSFNYNFNFTAAQSPSNYVGSTYTATLQNQSTGSIDYSQAFRILGYNLSIQYTNPAGTSIALPTGGSATTGLQFTNDGDSVFGTGNGDTISGIVLDTGSQGIGIAMMDPSVTSCGFGCQQETVADSNTQNWTVQTVCAGGTGNYDCTMTAYPATSGQSLAMNATLTVPNLQFNNSVGSHCANGCSATISMLPTHGVSWSQTNQSYATNPIYFTNGKSGVPSGTASVTHYGYVDTTATLHNGYLTQGYQPNISQMTYTSNSPFSSPAGYADEYEIVASNTSQVGTNPITQIEVQLPASYSPIPNATVDTTNSPGWKVVNCPAGSPASAICLLNANGNAGIAVGASQNIFLELSPPSGAAFAYTDWVVQAVQPNVFPLTPSGTFAGFVPNTSSYDNTAIAVYSLNANFITPSFSPTSEGQNTNNPVTINVTNTNTAQDPFPDYLDAITIDLPSTNGFTNVSGMPAGWSLLGTSTPAAGTTRYWFGLCAAQFNTSDGPVSNPPPVNPTLPSCGSAVEASAIAPGKTFTAAGNLQTGTSNVTATMYAHGANGAAWSTAHTFSLNVSAVTAAAGFSAAGGYPAAGSVTSPNTPQIGADSDVTYGNAFTYVIKNTSSTGQNLTSAAIIIPGLDVSSVLPADGSAWTLTNTPSISGTSYGCSVTGSASANRTGTNNGYGAYNGGITIGGGSCSIPPGSSITVTFDAKAPYTVNDSYQFTAKVNGSAQAAELWQTDTFVQIVMSANITVAVNPGNPGPGGSTPVVGCAPCSFNAASNLINFGTIANLQTVTGTDVLRVSVYTNAGTNNPWKLYVSTNSNPANTGTPTNELLTAIDSTHSAPTSGVNFDQTSFAVVPMTNPGLLLIDTGSGHAAQRTPFDEIMNFQISINGGSTAPQNSLVTYTFIAN